MQPKMKSILKMYCKIQGDTKKLQNKIDINENMIK